MFTGRDLKTDHMLFLIKAIALFNANEHQEAMLRIGELTASPDIDPIACRIVEAYLRVQLGNIALDGARYNEAVEHFTAAVNASAFFYKSPIHLTYDEFVALFGWNLKSLWQTANQQQCYALFRAGSFGAAIESYQSIMDKIDDDMKGNFRVWFTGKHSVISPYLSVHNHQLHFTQVLSKIKTRSILPMEMVHSQRTVVRMI
ncbi:uncharacterized protein EDB93DRAFT_86559 [Suillus bovinus]|uniref:uncharacterized protein n=1 Tax=Suillus bovinus TaxID=48563 RepID=UPI001B87F937|nr:uncharacterized protein EDB93DRAFT_86559 [Suillus bovinus]KAG2130199.1 hypothetical protein EDB93DRAFT_86559 [Suillus bovinus]